VGVAEQSVYLWENRERVLNLRDKTREALVSIKGLGAGETKSKLEETGGKRIKEGAAAPKERKKS
jgi:hypothetical protein